MSTGNAPLAVLFTDLSENATSRSWDFENDGILIPVTKLRFMCITLTGNYTANLTVSNANGTKSKLTTITVLPAKTGDDQVTRPW